MNNCLISILVPVYKVEAYLHRCIDSVLAQDFQNWELILVDDGSPDRCPQICDEYEGKNERIRVIHKKNGGLVSARQVGFLQSQGKYILYLDSDDWLMPNALSALYDYAEQGQYDIVRGCNRRVCDDGRFSIERGRFCKGEVKESENYLEKVITAEFEPYLWGALYRRDLFSKEVFEPMQQISTGEDWLTNIAIGKRVNKVLCIEDVVYNYYINSNSMMQQQVCSFEYVEKVKDILEILTIDASKYIKYLVKCNRMAAYINCMFVPELSFSSKHFKKVEEFIANSRNEENVRKMVDTKFLKFVHVPALFYLYSRFYCFMFKYIKLKGHKRRVLR